MTPHGVRVNNPGNIKWVKGKTSVYQGCTGHDDKSFCVFDTPFHGLRALSLLLGVYQNVHGLNTVRGIISRWSATDQASYIAAVSHRLHVGPDDPLDLHDKATLMALVTAVVRQENGIQPYPESLIASAVNTALGLPEPS